MTTRRLRHALAQQLANSPNHPVTAHHVAQAVTEQSALAAHHIIEHTSRTHADLTGLGPLQGLVANPDVTDIFVNTGGQVWFDCGTGAQRSDITISPESAVRALAVRLAAQCGQRLDDAMPWVDGHLPGRIRLHAVLPPVAAGGTHLSLRIPAQQQYSLDDLVRRGSVPRSWHGVLQRIVQSRSAFLVSGGTGAGKTTVLTALLGEAQPAERIVVVEDCQELTVPTPHAITLQCRRQNTEGAGQVTMSDLVRQALRMRPDRLIVGECRGAEITDLLLALNTGHSGGCATIHANSAHDVPNRIIALAGLAGWTAETTTAQSQSALHVLIHVAQHTTHRYVRELAIWQPTGVTPAASYDGQHRVTTHQGWAALCDLINHQPAATQELP